MKHKHLLVFCAGGTPRATRVNKLLVYLVLRGDCIFQPIRCSVFDVECSTFGTAGFLVILSERFILKNLGSFAWAELDKNCGDVFPAVFDNFGLILFVFIEVVN